MSECSSWAEGSPTAGDREAAEQDKDRVTVHARRLHTARRMPDPAPVAGAAQVERQPADRPRPSLPAECGQPGVGDSFDGNAVEVPQLLCVEPCQAQTP